MSTAYVSVYCTFPNEEDAARVCRALLDARLIACANIMGQGRSLYLWQGKMEDTREHFAIMKTEVRLFERVAGEIRKHHPYDTPCIVAWPIEAGYQAYLDWINNETV